MKSPPRKKKSHPPPPKRPLAMRTQGLGQGMLTEGYSLPQMVEDLRKYQLELEIQNKALRYSQRVAEGASERFLTLFSNVPLALMVVDEKGQVLESNAMALRLFRPLEHDPPLNFLLPLVDPAHSDAVAQAFVDAKQHGTSETSEVVFSGGSAAPSRVICTSRGSRTHRTNWPTSSARSSTRARC